MSLLLMTNNDKKLGLVAGLRPLRHRAGGPALVSSIPNELKIVIIPMVQNLKFSTSLLCSGFRSPSAPRPPPPTRSTVRPGPGGGGWVAWQRLVCPPRRRVAAGAHTGGFSYF